jgi:hypothetical protein
MRRRVSRLIAAAVLLLAGSLFCAPGWGGSGAQAATRGRDATTTQQSGGATPRSSGTAPRSGEATPRSGAGAAAEIKLPLSLSGPRRQIAMRPVGLSLEYPTMAQDLGTGACPPAALVAELRRLGSPPVALAGESQDLTVPPEAVPSPPSWETATLYTLPATFWSQLHCLLSEAGDPLDAGLNLRKGVPSWATEMAAGAESAATNGLEFSLGNEPDLYSLHNYAALAAPLPHAEAAAVTLYLQLAGALQQAIGDEPVIGPELATAGHWRRALPRVIGQLHERVVGVHLYPLSACEGPGAVTIPRLLSPAAANAPGSLAWVVADASAAQVPAILSEANSASCGGQAGVSDSPASAVWAVRFVLDALETGFQEVRFHFSGGSYDPFIVSGGGVLDRPLESALVALNQWLPVGASIQTLHRVRGLVATAIGSPGAPPSTPPTAPQSAPQSTPQLILDNESAKQQTVVLRGAGTVQVELLSATRAGLQTAQLSSARDRIKLTVAANSVLAVLP